MHKSPRACISHEASKIKPFTQQLYLDNKYCMCNIFELIHGMFYSTRRNIQPIDSVYEFQSLPFVKHLIIVLYFFDMKLQVTSM